MSAVGVGVTHTQQIACLASQILKQPRLATPEAVTQLRRWFLHCGLVYDSVAASNCATPVTCLVWIALVSVSACNTKAPPTRESLSAAASVPIAARIAALRRRLRPDTFLRKRLDSDALTALEIQELHLSMRHVATPAPATGADAIPETPDVRRAREKDAYKRNHLELTDAFYWLRYLPNLLKQFPIHQQFDLVSDAEMGHMTTMLTGMLQEKVGTDFDRDGRERIIKQQMTLGARIRFESDFKSYGSHYSVHDVFQHCFASDKDEKKVLTRQLVLPMLGIGTPKQHPELTPYSLDVWYLQAWMGFIKSRSVFHLDFIEEYCILWYDWGDPKIKELLQPVRLNKARLPLVINLGDSAWFVLHENRLKMARPNGGLIPALCLWHRIVSSDFRGEFEDGTKIPGYVPVASLGKKKKKKQQQTREKRPTLPLDLLQLSQANNALQSNGSVMFSVIPAVLDRSAPENRDDAESDSILTDEFGMARAEARIDEKQPQVQSPMAAATAPLLPPPQVAEDAAAAPPGKMIDMSKTASPMRRTPPDAPAVLDMQRKLAILAGLSSQIIPPPPPPPSNDAKPTPVRRAYPRFNAAMTGIVSAAGLIEKIPVPLSDEKRNYYRDLLATRLSANPTEPLPSASLSLAAAAAAAAAATPAVAAGSMYPIQ